MRKRNAHPPRAHSMMLCLVQTSIACTIHAHVYAQISLMRTLQHRYVVECIGYGSADPAGPSISGRGMFLVSELMEGGTLKKV